LAKLEGIDDDLDNAKILLVKMADIREGRQGDFLMIIIFNYYFFGVISYRSCLVHTVSMVDEISRYDVLQNSLYDNFGEYFE
jgi:hypothetical protein